MLLFFISVVLYKRIQNLLKNLMFFILKSVVPFQTKQNDRLETNVFYVICNKFQALRVRKKHVLKKSAKIRSEYFMY